MNASAPRLHNLLSRLAALALVSGLAACGGAGDPPPGWGDNLHADLTLASSEEGGGSLRIAYRFDKPVEVTFVQCFGGEAPECEGGVRLYAAEDPGFVALASNSASEEIYALPAETGIDLELVSASAEASLAIEGQTLDSPGDRVSLGSTPDLHAHGSWQLAIPGGEAVAQEYTLTIRARTEDGFDPSPEYVVLLHPEVP